MSITKKTLPLLLALAVFLPGCITQTLTLPALDPNGEPGAEFENSGYSMYVLFDLVNVKEAGVADLVAAVNTDNKTIHSIEVTSQGDWLSTVLNFINGGVVDRGVLFSMNKVTVKGRFTKRP
jgi:hypothetical protein